MDILPGQVKKKKNQAYNMWVNTQLDAYSLKHLIHLTPSISEEVKSLNTEVYFSGQIKNWMKILNLASMGIKRNEFS